MSDKMREALERILSKASSHQPSMAGQALFEIEGIAKVALTQQPESDPTCTVCDNDGLNCNVCGFDPEAQQPESENPIAFTGSGSLAAIKAGEEGYIWGAPAKAHPVALYLGPQPTPQVPEGYEIIKHLSGNWYFRHADSQHASANYWSTREQATTRAWEHFYRQIRRAQEKALELCVAVENEDDLPPIKYALRAGKLVNEVKDLCTAAPSIAEKLEAGGE